MSSGKRSNLERVEKSAMTRLVVSALGAVLIWSGAMAQENAAPASGVAKMTALAEITADDVYLRSGDSMNHYTIFKLKAGDRVTVVGERGDWFEVLPPEGTFSLVSGDFVDTVDGKSGVVNGDNVRVRAGSLLNNNKYTVQTMLHKGAAVTILGNNPDGFLRIVPPQGATLWLNRNYATLLSDAQQSSADGSSGKAGADATTPRGETPTPNGPSSDNAQSTKSAGKMAAAIPPDSPLAAVPPTDRLRQLHAIEAGLELELTKPVYERQFDPLLARYRALVEQQEDEDVARRFALSRIQQINGMLDTRTVASQLRGLDEQADRHRREFLEQRMQIPMPPSPGPAALDAQGELRESAIYPPGTLPRRFRLVDPAGDGARTIAYVEIPAGSSLRPEEFVGRYVGIRASSKKAQEGSVDPIPIYVVGEIIYLDPGDSRASSWPE